jgi:hypothetical protein
MYFNFWSVLEEYLLIRWVEVGWKGEKLEEGVLNPLLSKKEAQVPT